MFVTASQLNRGAVEEIEFDHSHIAGGLSKINTADNVFGIFTSRAMRERGRYQLQLMKTRSSSGVGQKVDLEFDVNSLRIRDLDEEEKDVIAEARSKNLRSVINKKIDKVSSVPEGAVPSNIMQKIQAKEVPESLLGRTSQPQEENLLGRTE